LGEVESELSKKDDGSEAEDDMEAGVGTPKKTKQKSMFEQFLSPVFIQCFTMTFLAEWGDRSQIATIALAAAKDPYGDTHTHIHT
jgi:putative Ca2+/H+ antiporter (TMEM165/GDT1 family)